MLEKLGECVKWGSFPDSDKIEIFFESKANQKAPSVTFKSDSHRFNFNNVKAKNKMYDSLGQCHWR